MVWVYLFMNNTVKVYTSFFQINAFDYALSVYSIRQKKKNHFFFIIATNFNETSMA